MANVSVIIPSFNGLSLLKKHLTTVLESMRSGDELIIVDDASQDKTLVYLKELFRLNLIKQTSADADQALIYQGFTPQKNPVIVRSQLQNQRFASSCNQAVQAASQALVFLVNNDVSLQPDTIQSLVDCYQTLTQPNQPVFAIACLEYEGVNQQANQAGKNILYFNRGLFWHRKARDFTSGVTAWASGGSSLFNRKLWLELKGFDLGFYPAYWEDVDLSFRARKKGYLVYFNARSVVYHQHESTHANLFSQSVMTKTSQRHQRLFTLKNGDIWQKLAYVIWRPYWLIYNSYHRS